MNRRTLIRAAVYLERDATNLRKSHTNYGVRPPCVEWTTDAKREYDDRCAIATDLRRMTRIANTDTP